MDQFTVPQFIDREPKILGPITIRQFLICLVGFGLGFLAFKYSDFELFIFEAIVIAVVFGVFAFVNINGRPFHYFVLALIGSKKRPNVRVWKKDAAGDASQSKINKEQTKEQKQKTEDLARQQQINQGVAKKRLARSRLSKLSLTVDTGGRYREKPE